MEAIMELIFGNLFFVIIVIGGLFSLFKRMKSQGNEQDQSQGRAQGQHQHDPKPDQGKVDWRELFKQEEFKEVLQQPAQSRSKQGQNRPAVASQIDTGMDHSLRDRELQDSYETTKMKQKKVIKRVTETTESTHSSNSLDLRLNKLAGKEAMKAVVWAEVLGAPRARNPHQTFTRKH